MEKWFIRNVQPKMPIDQEKLKMDPVLFQILLNRGLSSEGEMNSFLHPSPRDFYSPIKLKDMVKAGNLLRKIYTDKKRIRIIGDYDVDGIMSTVILMKGLRILGFQVDYDIPHRIYDGYGLQKRQVEEASEDGISLIVTCDNGVSAFESVELAKELGIQVIVTDHHDLVKERSEDETIEERLPAADAIINPKQEKCNYPNKNLCGAAVAYKLVHYLFTIFGKAEELPEELIGYAAMATICDVMELLGENRSLVRLGLERINQSVDPAVLALKEGCSIDGDINDYHIGYVIGPTLNSAGRLDSAEKGVELFLSSDYDNCMAIVRDLRELNRKRQELTEEGFEKIEEQLQNIDERKNKIYILREDTIHESVAGIIAGRMKNKYQRPCIVITRSEKGLKGSGRSIEAYNMVEEIGKSREYLTSFGGHPMACGLSLLPEQFESFKRHVLQTSTLTEEDLIPVRKIDLPLPFSMVDFAFVEMLENLRPFGNGNEAPSFGAKNVRIKNLRLLGRKKNVLKMDLIQDNKIYVGVYFHDSQEFLWEIEERYGYTANSLTELEKSPVFVDLIYIPKKNVFRNQVNLQFEILSIRFCKDR